MNLRRFLFKNSPAYWGFYYVILALVVFPICYFVWADDFHYATITKEQFYEEKLTEFERLIKYDFSKILHFYPDLDTLRGYAPLSFYITYDLIDPVSIRTTRFENGALKVFLSCLTRKPARLDTNGKPLSDRDEFINENLSVRLPFSLDPKNGVQKIESSYKMPVEFELLSSNNVDLGSTRRKTQPKLRLLWVRNPVAPFKKPITEIEVSQKTMTLIKELYSLNQNKPVNPNNKIGRAFYLSIVTITTLGFGDIVPVTMRARGLISLESFVGIMLMGLFLNAVARSRNA